MNEQAEGRKIYLNNYMVAGYYPNENEILVSKHWIKKSGFNGKLVITDGMLSEGPIAYECDFATGKQVIPEVNKPQYPEPFWMVWVSGTRGPAYQHYDKASAEREAERLARLSGNEGRDVYVLEVVASCKAEVPPVEWIR